MADCAGIGHAMSRIAPILSGGIITGAAVCG
jgi:hypothetical protein